MTKKLLGPPGWSRLSTEKRYANVGAAPRTFDREARSADAVLSKGTAVPRSYGLEKLRISKSAVDLDRLHTSGIPLLDSHNQYGIGNALGRVVNAWIEGDALIGQIQFNRTDAGELALGMVERGELSALSVGYTVSKWEISDNTGKVLDPAVDRIRYDDELTFTATRWHVLELSAVTVPADPSATFRSWGGPIGRARAARARMRLLANMPTRNGY
jgi:phage head maturation protease